MSGRAESRLGAEESALLRRLVMDRSEPLEDRELPADRAVNWELLLLSANRHRLTPLASEALLEGNASRRVPIGILERFQNAVSLELARAVVHLHHVDEIGAVAHQEDLESCLLKGAAFARALYPRPGLRPMADLDILVRFSDWNRWSECLESIGYTLVDRSDHAACFRRRQTGVFVELHQALTSQASFLGFDAGAALDRAVPLPSSPGVNLSTLTWEDHLLHLCLHGSFQHGFRQAAVNAWDARCIAEHPDFDLGTFVARASEPRLAPWVYGGLAMSEAVFSHRKLADARQALEAVLPRRILRKARRFQAEALLSPNLDSVWGTPVERLSWVGLGSAFSLLLQITRPQTREAREGSIPWARLARIQHLVRSHGIATIRAIWSRRPEVSVGPTSASLGEVRDV